MTCVYSCVFGFASVDKWGKLTFRQRRSFFWILMPLHILLFWELHSWKQNVVRYHLIRENKIGSGLRNIKKVIHTIVIVKKFGQVNGEVCKWIICSGKGFYLLSLFSQFHEMKGKYLHLVKRSLCLAGYTYVVSQCSLSFFEACIGERKYFEISFHHGRQNGFGLAHH